MKKTIAIILILLTFVACIVTSPQIALQSAKAGFNMWWSFIFPVLLPMYMLIHLCRALGLFHSIAYIIISLLNIKRVTPSQFAPYVFRWFVGATYIGATPTPDLRNEKPMTMSKKTLMALITLSYNANPIFIVVIVFTAFVPIPWLGIYIVICLAATTLLCGLLIRLFSKTSSTLYEQSRSILNQLEHGRKEDGRPIGRLLGEGIYESVQQLFTLGGIILFASVVAAYLQQLLPDYSSFEFMFIIDQHIASYALLNSPLNTSASLTSLLLVLCFGGLTQLFITYGLLKQHLLSFRHFLTLRLLYTIMFCLIIYFNYNWLERTFHLSAIETSLPNSALTFKAHHHFMFLLSSSSFVSSLLLISILCLTLITTFLINRYYKNKQA